MRWFGVLAILAYRLFVRPLLRRRCLYLESCSAYGIRMMREHGLVAGWVHARARIHACRMPAGACFVLDDVGRARLLSISGQDGHAAPDNAAAILATYAETQAHRLVGE